MKVIGITKTNEVVALKDSGYVSTYFVVEKFDGFSTEQEEYIIEEAEETWNEDESIREDFEDLESYIEFCRDREYAYYSEQDCSYEFEPKDLKLIWNTLKLDESSLNLEVVSADVSELVSAGFKKIFNKDLLIKSLAENNKQLKERLETVNSNNAFDKNKDFRNAQTLQRIGKTPRQVTQSAVNRPSHLKLVR